MSATAQALISNYEVALKRLSLAAKLLSVKHHDQLDKLKNGSQELQKPDWLWRSLLLSLSTQGNSRGAEGLIRNAQNYNRVAYDALDKLDDHDRLQVLKQTLRLAKVRMPDKKADWLFENFRIVKSMGGPRAAKELLLQINGSEEKIQWLKHFNGIGLKYSRNMMMDVYHPDFHDRIAIDQRIISISKLLGVSFNRYAEHEQFYLDVAREARLQGWELDRLLYNFQKEFVTYLTRNDTDAD